MSAMHNYTEFDKTNPVEFGGIKSKDVEQGFEIKLIVAGSRRFNDFELLKSEVVMFIAEAVSDKFANPENASLKIEIVSGGATGADNLGERFAKERNDKLKIFTADWNTHGKKAGYLRNRQMAEYATHCICFWDGKSKGTKMMIELARQNGLHTHIVNFK